jgi:hypothetical protein
MDSIIFLPSALLGFVCISVHMYVSLRRKEQLNIAIMANAFLQSSGIVCGFFLILGSLYAPAKEYLKGIDLYILIAGLVVLVISVQGLYNDIFRKIISAAPASAEDERTSG